MKVILLDNIKSVGEKGDVKEVQDGYARNFLFPQHLAVEANAQSIKQNEERKKSETSAHKKQIKADRELISKIDGMEIILNRKSDSGKLYASVNVKDIVEGLKDEGFKVRAEDISFEPVKEVGSYQATVSRGEFDATIEVIVESAQ